MEDKLVTLAILTYTKAQILKNVLENEGIETYIHNVNQIQPVVSSGVRLRIKESDLPRALKITESSTWLSESIVGEKTPKVDNKSNKNEAFIKAAKRCIDYTDYHFKTEEKIMDIINYSDAENHKAMHKDFYNEVVKQISRYQEGQPFVANKLVKYLKDWLLEHIAFRDKIFVEELMRVLRERENK